VYKFGSAFLGRDDGGQSVAAGVYFYRLDAREFSATKRMMLVKSSWDKPGEI
jgi:hypothetical protein